MTSTGRTEEVADVDPDGGADLERVASGGGTGHGRREPASPHDLRAREGQAAAENRQQSRF